MDAQALEAKIKQLEAENSRLKASSGSTDYDSIVEFIMANQSKYSSRRLLAKAIAETGMCKESSAFHYLSLENYVLARIRYSQK